MSSPRRHQYGPPIDLSDLPGYTTAERGHVTAFLGRCSTRDNQDPASSIPGQAATAAVLLDDGEEYAAYYWDVESGMLDVEDRGQGTVADYDALHVPLPRDGGLNDLLEAATQGRITRVACERINRCARDLYASLTVERQLASLGVEVLAANEPQVDGMTSGKLRMRRGAQMDAEIYRYEMLEMSMRGQQQHAAQGYNHGRPPYGYVAVVDEDAQLRPSRFGRERPKKRLALHPDERRATTVAEVFRLRIEERLTRAQIRALMETAPNLHPIDGLWTDNRIGSILANPKYTGHQVYNRKATRTRNSQPNPISAWTWSPKEVHPKIITLGQWHQAQVVNSELRTSTHRGLDRVREAARERGLGVQFARSTPTHVVYRVGDREFVVQRGHLPAPVAARIISELEMV